MKQFVLLLLLIVVLLSAGMGCTEQYIEQDPMVHLVITGSVVDKEGDPIPGIKITPKGKHMYTKEFRQLTDDLVLTDSMGSFKIEVTTKPWSLLYIFYQDIDGPANGGEFYDNETFRWIAYDYYSHNTPVEVSGDIWDFGIIDVSIPSIRMNRKE